MFIIENLLIQVSGKNLETLTFWNKVLLDHLFPQMLSLGPQSPLCRFCLGTIDKRI